MSASAVYILEEQVAFLECIFSEVFKKGFKFFKKKKKDNIFAEFLKKYIYIY